MTAIEIVEAFEKEYYPMDFFSNQQCSQHFTRGWCAAKSAEVQKTSHNTGSQKLLSLCKRIVNHADAGIDLPAGHPIIDDIRNQLRAGA